MKALIILCLAFQAIILTGKSAETEDVDFSILVINEMHNLKRPAVFYHCRSSEKDIGWHKSVPFSKFHWNFQVPRYGNGVMIHNCEFRSSQGTAEIEIKTVSTTAILCDGQICKYAIRPDGVYLIGYELYFPFGRFLEFSRPVEKLVEPWKPWSPRQVKAFHPSNHQYQS